MKKIIPLLLLIILSCKSNKETEEKSNSNINATDAKNSFTIAFGSCNHQNTPNELWDDILKNDPDIWIWGGDIIYADTEDMKLMQSHYNVLKNNKDYQDFISKVEVLATWDDHDYGKNDAGIEFVKKDSAQQLFLDFIDINQEDLRRKREGVYHAKTYTIDDKSVKVLLLDTRYFRTALIKDPTGVKRYIPSKDSSGTILGNTQWQWLNKELTNSKADFNIIVSSIQFLSSEHGWESWGNMPNEVEKLKDLIASSNAHNTIILSGDRHIAEISKMEYNGLKYPLYDITSSGLTHVYESYTHEPNKYRISEVIKEINFGILKFNFDTNTVEMEIRGNDNVMLENIIQKY